jgi:hypothetical protein
MKTLIYAVSILTTLLIFTHPLKAQDLSVGVAKYVIIQDTVEPGDLISTENGKYVKTKSVGDKNFVGSVTNNPALELVPINIGNRVAIIDKGQTKIKVSSENGVIQVGDLLTTSDIPGVAVKQTISGFSIGTALSPYTQENKSEVGQILANLEPSINFSSVNDKAKKNILDVFSIGAIASSEQPSEVLKHIISGLVLLISIVIGFLTFARVAAHGVEAIGRNPSARLSIGFSIAINSAITLAIISAGVFVAYLIISL